MTKLIQILILSFTSIVSFGALFFCSFYPEFMVYEMLLKLTGTESLRQAAKPLAFLMSGGLIAPMPLWVKILTMIVGVLSLYVAIFLGINRHNNLSKLMSVSYWQEYRNF